MGLLSFSSAAALVGRFSKPAYLLGSWVRRVQGVAHDLLRLAHDGVEVSLVLEAFRVDLVNVLRAGRPRREPAAASDDLQTADRRVVARGAGQPGRDGFAGELRLLDGLGRE